VVETRAKLTKSACVAKKLHCVVMAAGKSRAAASGRLGSLRQLLTPFLRQEPVVMLSGGARALPRICAGFNHRSHVALHAAERALDEGASVVCLSNSKGVAHFGDEGLQSDQLDLIKSRQASGKRLEEIAESEDSFEFEADASVWSVDCDIAMPCATQNELEEQHAKELIENGVKMVVEGANMPCASDATDALRDADVIIGPGKAANAGGVAVSGFEMMQNASRSPWSRDRVLERLDEVMTEIHQNCVDKGERDRGPVDYIRGANLAAFDRLGRAIVAAGPN